MKDDILKMPNGISNPSVALYKTRLPQRALPIPSNIRQRERIQYWQERLWRAQNKWFVLLSPQHRELVRKIGFSCERASLPGMITLLRFGLLILWFFTGNVRKMEDFVEAVFNGRVFLMSPPSFFSDIDLPVGTSELRKMALLYDPHVHKSGVNDDQIRNATLFSTYLAPVPKRKPWAAARVAEEAEERKQAVAELGAETVQNLWSFDSTLSSDAEGRKLIGPADTPQKPIAYW